MHASKVNIGTRKSPLALKQVAEITALLQNIHPDIDYEIIGIDTYGDKDKSTPISEIEGSDFFTREIEYALLSGKIDFAVHSAKDLPDKIPEGLVIAAITKSYEPFDALVSRNNLPIDKLTCGARIGASSQRRKEQLKKYRSDLMIVDIRGTIFERLKRLEDPDKLDAVIIAACALVRLELESMITQRMPFDILKPNPLQGSLAIEARKDNIEILRLLAGLNEK